MGDLDRATVAVDEVEPVKELAAGARTLKDLHLEVEVLSKAVAGGAHLRINDLANIAACRDHGECRGRIDLRSVKRLV